MVEIIPKPAAKLPSWQNIISYLSVGLILLVVLSYFVLNLYSLDKAETKLKDLEKELEQTKTAEQTALEQELSDYEKKIQNFSILIDRYLFSSKAFEFIEENTHPEAWFSILNLDPRKGEVALSGDTENFVTLHQQVQIFKDNPSVQGLNLANIAIGKEGRIAFNLNLILDPGLFKLNE
jgi:hypothetical protein